MNSRRVELWLKHMAQLHPASPRLSAPEARELVGITPQEQEAAEHMWVDGHEAGRPARALQTVRWAFLTAARPGMDERAAVESLDAELLERYVALEPGDLDRLDVALEGLR